MLAQNKYWIFFEKRDGKNINVSEQTILNRALLRLNLLQETDLQISGASLDSISQIGVKVINRSRWLNGVTAYLTENQISILKSKPFIRSLSLVKKGLYLASDEILPSSFAIEQTHSSALKAANLDGKNILIGVIDGGFYMAHKNPALKHVFKNLGIKALKNFTNASQDLFESSNVDNSSHGGSVLQLISGYDSKEQYGAATKSKFYLAKSEVQEKEFRGEEDYWIAALEWMDSLGVRLVNSSLGYSDGFDNATENYKPNEMDGSTSAIARAAKIAISDKGMIIVASAGNEGYSKWQVITTPADAINVITVGATDYYGQKKGISSIGPSFLPYIKPNISCFSSTGTSFSAPVITGIIACMLEKKPSLKAAEVMSILEKSSSLYPYPNNFIGFGVPDARKILRLLANSDTKTNVAEEVVAVGNSYKLSLSDSSEPYLVFFNKSDSHAVKNQGFINQLEASIHIERPLDVARTTIVLQKRIIEIIWK